eukprot:CAMPEP_0116887666 /NCGR_PEP_ID=MMETSP0463-20121206/22270_1 /TAXON_ID=181622 /ORGANISM="Strombidinopsis sp, Strain SopsisLIS2011" /LENGTH=83 /DNA_ID=CAMNT_0004550823 /DNA_START=153 /DNA_END=404 /DNA_ORIENTATION=-
MIYQVLSFGVMVSTAVMIWTILKLVSNTDSPVVVVLSGSMEPGMWRGDILFLEKNSPLDIGDIVVYQAKQEEAIPIVHRITSI